MDAESSLFTDKATDIVSRTAYLIGIPKNIFDNIYEAPRLDVYKSFEASKNARIVRNLCMLRTAIIKNANLVDRKRAEEGMSILSLSPQIPQECINQLFNDGISVLGKNNQKALNYIITINRYLADRLNNCKSLFPIWLDWNLIRDLILMPDGLKEAGVKKSVSLFFENIMCYPYQVYINWKPKDVGNLLYNDKKFVTLLYEMSGRKFTDLSLVSDVNNEVKKSIHTFLQESDKTVVIVDCENSDPYRLCSVLRQLDAEHAKKITSIILYDDIHASSGWSILEDFTNIPVDYILVERLKQDKSLVDVKLTARTCQEYYQNHVNSFIIVSSDSDYWGLITELPDAKFLMMVEHEKCGPDIKNALRNSGIYFCYIDDFYSGDSRDIQIAALLREMRRYLDNALNLNVNVMLNEALQNTRIQMSKAERNQFYDRYIKSLRFVLDEKGNASIEIK